MEVSELLSLPSLSSKKRGNPNWIKKMPSPHPNAAGRISTGLQDPGPRAKILLEKYSPKQIMEYAANIQKAPLSTSDAIIVIHLANILKADGLERERLYDRTFGKVPERQINLNVNVDSDPDQLSDKALEILSNITD